MAHKEAIFCVTSLRWQILLLVPHASLCLKLLMLITTGRWSIILIIFSSSLILAIFPLANLFRLIWLLSAKNLLIFILVDVAKCFRIFDAEAASEVTANALEWLTPGHQHLSLCLDENHPREEARIENGKAGQHIDEKCGRTGLENPLRLIIALDMLRKACQHHSYHDWQRAYKHAPWPIVH